MANKVYENSQLICKYFKDAGIILHVIKLDAEEQTYSVPAIPSQNIHWSSSCNNFKYRMVSCTTVNSYSQCKF